MGLSVKGRFSTMGATIIRWLASDRFFCITLVFFALQALWLAFTALYPMAFDESYHFGLIQLHARQWLPFFAHQPAGVGGDYGPITRDPSYLYHFLMSLPYRLVDLFHPSFMTLVISLRVVDIALFVLNFILFRRLLFRMGASRPLAHAILFVFSLIPVVPFLAAHINYDNLFITLLIAALLLTFGVVDDLRRHQLSLPRLLGLSSVLAAGSIVKYPYLPIAAALVLVVGIYAVLQQRHWRELLAGLVASYRRMSVPLRVGLIALALITGSLFAERYAINLWQYHTPSPDCGDVLDTDSCLSYGPWARNYGYKQNLPDGFTPDRIRYPLEWIQGMWTRSFFAINNDFVEEPPLPIPSWTAAIVGIFGAVLLLPFGRRVFSGNRYRLIALFALALYTIALFVQTYAGYLMTGHLVAINGRYLVPFMPVIFLFVGLAFSHIWRAWPLLKPYAVVLVFLLLLQGGGFMTFILRSQPSWDWRSPLIIHANNIVRSALSYVVAGSRQ